MSYRMSSLPQPYRKRYSPSPAQPKIGFHSIKIIQRLLPSKIINQHLNAKQDDGRANNKILIRKNRNRLNRDSRANITMRQTMNNLSRIRVEQSGQVSLGANKKQRQRYIDILQTKIIQTNSCQNIPSPPKNQTFYKKLDSTRYNNVQINRESVQNIKINESFDREDSNFLSPQPKDKVNSRKNKQVFQIVSFRNRSRTINKETIIKRVDEGEISRTIEINAVQSKQKLQKSLVQIELFDKNSLGRNTKQVIYQNREIQIELGNPSVRLPSHKKDQVLSQDTAHINNTQTYQKQILTLTKDFFQEWEKMNFNKSKIYKNLRRKLVSIFPNMKKHYREFKESHELTLNDPAQQQAQAVDQLMMYTHQMKDLKAAKGFSNSELRSFSNNASLRVTEIKDFQQKMDEFHQKKLLKEIFKQAYFWSRTKNKFMSSNFQDEQEQDKREMVNLKKIQKNLTFMNYMKSKTNKSQILHNRNKIKGFNIIKNADSILQIEKEGTKQQEFLKKCLENAIQNCIRQNH